MMNPRGLEFHQAAGFRPKPRVKAAALFGGGREVIIEHFSQEYRLRITKQGKLILTK
jgi:hemin uptake protein HemP